MKQAHITQITNQVSQASLQTSTSTEVDHLINSLINDDCFRENFQQTLQRVPHILGKFEDIAKICCQPIPITKEQIKEFLQTLSSKELKELQSLLCESKMTNDESENLVLISESEDDIFQLVDNLLLRRTSTKKVLLLSQKMASIDKVTADKRAKGRSVATYKSSFSIMINLEKFAHEIQNNDLLVIHSIVFFDDLLRKKLIPLEQFDSIVLLDFDFRPEIPEFNDQGEQKIKFKFSPFINKELFTFIKQYYYKRYSSPFQSSIQDGQEQLPTIYTLLNSEDVLQYDTDLIRKLQKKLKARYCPMESTSTSQTPSQGFNRFQEQFKDVIHNEGMKTSQYKQEQQPLLQNSENGPTICEDQAYIELKRFYTQIYRLLNHHGVPLSAFKPTSQSGQEDDGQYKGKSGIITPRYQVEEVTPIESSEKRTLYKCNLKMPSCLQFPQMLITSNIHFKNCKSSQSNVAFYALWKLNQMGFLNEDLKLDSQRYLAYLEGINIFPSASYIRWVQSKKSFPLANQPHKSKQLINSISISGNEINLENKSKLPEEAHTITQPDLKKDSQQQILEVINEDISGVDSTTRLRCSSAQQQEGMEEIKYEQLPSLKLKNDTGNQDPQLQVQPGNQSLPQLNLNILLLDQQETMNKEFDHL